MATIPKPASKTARNTKGEPPTVADVGAAPSAMNKAGRTSKNGNGKVMTFNVDPEWHRQFKTFASENDMSLKGLLELGFTLAKKHHG